MWVLGYRYAWWYILTSHAIENEIVTIVNRRKAPSAEWAHLICFRRIVCIKIRVRATYVLVRVPFLKQKDFDCCAGMFGEVQSHIPKEFMLALLSFWYWNKKFASISGTPHNRPIFPIFRLQRYLDVEDQSVPFARGVGLQNWVSASCYF